MERLLPKNTPHDQQTVVDEDKMELISKVVGRNGGTFYLPSGNTGSNKITNVRKWEQAFRVYAVIYSKANPQRSAEIWQYVYVINTAANSFLWDNVASYDYTFRQLMSAYPNRSWAKTYTQMWNLCMKNPIPDRAGGGSTFTSPSFQRGKSKDPKEDYCWKFNRNHCNRGTRCQWEDRCLYCDGWGHGLFNCLKRKDKRTGFGGSSAGSSGSSSYHSNHADSRCGDEKRKNTQGNKNGKQ